MPMPRKVIAAVAGVILVAGGVVVATASRVPATSVPGGISFGANYEAQLESEAPAARAHVMAAMKQRGVSWVRVDSPATIPFDAVIRSAVTAGLRVDLLIQDWRTADTPAAIADLSGSLARRYHPMGITTYELLNEPNNYPRSNPLPPASYASLLKASYPRIHAVVPGATVITAGMGNPASVLPAYAYLSAMYAAGAHGSFDAVGVHPYAFPDLPSTDDPQSNPWQYMPMGRDCPHGDPSPCIRTMMQAHGDGEEKLWITEFGASTATYSPSFQAHSISEAFAYANASGYAGPLFNYQWQDDTEDDFGLLTSSGGAKPALAAFTKGVHGGGS